MKQITIVCVGQPNVGKSSLVNKICGVHLKVGNFTGVTIEKAEARIEYKGYILRIIDLPGTYALNEYSFEEQITKQFLETQEYDVILNVLDSTNLERCLLLTTQLMELQSKMCLALNMSDEAKKEGIEIDSALLGEILGVECVSVSAFYGENLETLLDRLIHIANEPLEPNKRVYADFLENEISKVEDFLKQKHYEDIERLLALNHRGVRSLRDIAIKLLMQDNFIAKSLHDKGCWVELSEFVNKCTQRLYKQSQSQNVQDIFNDDSISFAKGASMESSRTNAKKQLSITQRLDAILLNTYLGIPIFLFLMWLLFQVTFYLGEFPKVWIEESMASFGDLVQGYIANEFVASLLSGGIIAGVGAVLSFLPHILILFCGIVLLEGTGYMARVAFLLDGFFHKFGLHGKSFIPLVTGFGCSVPAYMSTRMLKNRNDRMLTLFIINFMSCGARLPVYTLFIGAFFTPSVAGNVLYGIYIFGALVGLCMAKILKLTAFRGDDEPFVMEMPKYRLPSLRLIAFSVWQKAVSYVKKAGSFILLASVIIWVGTQFPHNETLEQQTDETVSALESKIAELEKQRGKEECVQEWEYRNADGSAEWGASVVMCEDGYIDRSIESIQDEIENIQHTYQSNKVERSYLGRIGKFIEPIFTPMDFDWKISVSLLNGLLAKETIISSMGVLYALGEDIDENNDMPLREILQEHISLPSAIAFILFIMFYNPCFAASIAFGKEAGGKRFIAYLFVFTSVVSYIFAFVGYKITQLIVG
ncbi:ferrous iron transport protein B [Helicobacter cinaedi]|uniref:Ferrous iron transport protein B n=1 Tax=Helicobacter cinaedi TaxID=213 RepID=A0A377JT54_9HELI|nr:ferrous iron transport protein B [Helicobacter cinaedi]STP11171.1 ferrous iron transport protein B [Helicobacter cinaedi]